MERKDTYEDIYNYDIEDNTKYEELDENESEEEAIERLKNTIGRGDCIYCGEKLAMQYEGKICFICSKCGQSVHEDIYYRWIAGYLVEIED